MKKIIIILLSLTLSTTIIFAQSDLILTGLIDGPLTGGTPKAAEIYVSKDIADLSIYGLGSANNGDGTDGEEFTFPAVSATAGSFIYVASESPNFTTFMGFAPDYTASVALSINGDDAVELFKDGSVVDVFGDINLDGTGQPWDHLDGWAYRVDGTGPDGTTFVLANWTFSGINALDGETTNATAATPFPTGTYAPNDELILTGLIDGPLTGGVPKAAEIYVSKDIADLSIYGLGSANNGDGTDGEEFTFPAVSATAGSFIYVASESPNFTTFMGFAPDYTSSGALSINGDDAVELFKDGSVVDIFGDISLDGTGQPWEYEDGWAYRVDGTGPDGTTFILANWLFSGKNALDGEATNATAATPFPTGTYSYTVSVETSPSVSSTSPSDSEADILVNADIIVYFSEDVNVAGTWYSISGSSSGGHTAVVSGGPSDFTLNPDVDFDAGETITVTVYATAVNDLDSDDPPDNMDVDYIFNFNTAVPASGWIINEVHADPAGDISGDANGDGTRHGTDDEFVEIVNNTGGSVDISGWTLADGIGIKHTFPTSTVVPDQSAIVVFGGGTPTGTFGYAIVQIASTGTLGLNNSGDTVTLNNGTTDVAVEIYGGEGGDNQSLTRDPDITGSFVKHSVATGSGGALFSPGAMIDGSPFPGAVIPVPWIINEIHADPAGDISGDANGDGTRHGTDDEFVEIVNNTGSSVDISGWTLADEVGMRHTFPASTVIPDQSAIVVFGGGTPTGTFGYAIVQIASSGSLGLNNGGDTVTLNNGTADVAVEIYGGEGGDDQSLTRDPDITGSFVKHSVATGSGGALFSPGAMIDGSPFPGAVIPPAVLEIFEIQGAGLISPYVGQNVITENNVVTVLGTNGFFMQTPTARTDADANTSDGIFVFTGGTPTVTSGDLINVTADVVEFYEFTELSSPVITTLSSGATLPNPVVFDATVPSPGAPQASIEYERFEGMLISIEDGTVTGPNQRFSTDIVAEVHIVAGPNRTFRETGLEYPGLGAPIPTWDGNPEIFELDPDKFGLPNIMIPAGSSFSADGVLGFEYGDYELWPYALDVVENTIPKPLRIPSAGERTIGSLNLYRLFDDADDGGEYVASTAEYDRRLSKFSMYIRNVLKSPDILAVQEVEKLGVLEDLAVKILADDASIVYTAYLEEGNDIGGIDVGFLVREDRVQVDGITQLGKAETFIDPGDQSVDILHDRPPLLLEGYFIVAGEPIYPISVIGVHNRSLSSIETIRVQTKRLTQAQYIAQVAQDMQVANPDIHLVVTGDFNGFEFTDGYVDVIGQIMGDIIPVENVLSGPDLVDPNLTNQVLSLPASDRYSFIYRGSAQVLDHALTTTALNPAVTEFAYGRGNADAAVDLINSDSTPLRSSDHDGLLLYLDVTPPEIILAEPRQLWSVNHKYRTIELSDIILSATDESQLPVESAYIIKVTSDELEDDKGKGDGNTLDDIAIIDCQTVDLRAERNGTGNGRVYTIHIAIEDLYGNIGNAAYQVLVPHNKKSEAIDDGPIYEVVADCSAPETLLSDEVGVYNSEIIGLTIPDNYSINQNYPNPFNPTTTIQYNLPETNFVSIIVYDMLGRQIKTLVNKQVSAGYHSVKWGATDDQGMKVSTGMYIYSIKAGSFVQTRKMVIMK